MWARVCREVAHIVQAQRSLLPARRRRHRLSRMLLVFMKEGHRIRQPHPYSSRCRNVLSASKFLLLTVHTTIPDGDGAPQFSDDEGKEKAGQQTKTKRSVDAESKMARSECHVANEQYTTSRFSVRLLPRTERIQRHHFQHQGREW